ncbi:hypothetical protein JRQ81_019759 [Phrynocephalus forsythii]|uniref:NEDD4-binding protein 2-like 2 n=1 Tax=Phrynocephalus forsythii TaxID=171643 RepID=A0A9Q0XN94_9SAUR|nr:hypothetical protein JRQ81_019759 [Phrynocephalus forsythii]
MLHTERKPRYYETQDVPATEPCSKRIKSAEEPYGKSYDGLKKLHEEVHVKKTHSGFIPLSLSDDYNIEATRPQEKETAEDLHPFNRAIADKRTEPSNSLSNAQVAGSQCPHSTDNTRVDNKKPNVVQKDNKGDSELYTTSKVFIGPIYKTEADCRHDGRNQSIGHSCQNTKLAGRSKKMPPQQPPSCHLPKIEDELSQFYSEIDQLESNENYLDGDLQGIETNSQGQPVEYNKLDQSFPVNSQEWSCRASPSWNNGQCLYTTSGVYKISHEQYPSSDSTVFRNSNRQCYKSQKAICETEQLCNKQEGSRFWSTSVPEFKSGWTHTHPFITPYGPPPPQCNTHFNFQEPSSSFHSAMSSPPNVGPFKNIPINMNCSADQNSEYTSCFGTHCAPTSRNGYNVPDRREINGFCEAQSNWKDVRTCWTEGLSTGSQQFSKDRLCESKKLLIFLRGLPGSGKTTLSHVLLGQSRDGIVFSTDDYFCQNNGCWSYDTAQLGAAHDWNQKRAKQAMDQGTSPIIIDNTNTQAWEMKPYVEVALEKGYQVEFHEPDTWWKFNPEELERRNKHGVSREKIVQMLERYEYHMSVPIVMNSVLPFHKTSQRPPPQRRQRDSVVKKPHRFYKTKQKRKRKRNKKMKGAATKTIGKRSDGDFSPSEDELSQSGQEDLENNGESQFVTGPPVEHKEESEESSAKDSCLKHFELHNRTFLDSHMVDSVASDNSLNAKSLVRSSDLSLMRLLSATDEIVPKQSFQLCGTQCISTIKSESRILERNNQSILKPNSGTDKLTAMRSIEDEDKFAGVILELSVGSKLLSNMEEVTAVQQEALQNTEIHSWALFSTDLVEKQQDANSDKNKYLTWPEDSSVIMYEQRPKRERRSKQIFSETGKLTDYKFSKKTVEQEDGEILLEKSDIKDCVVPSLQAENSCKMLCIAVGGIPNESRTKGSISNDAAMLAPPRKNRRCKRIFKLASNFDFPRQIAAKNYQEVIMDVLMEQDGISNKGTREKKKPSLGHYGCPAHSSCDTATVLMSTISFEASLPNDRQLVPFNQIMKTNKEEKQNKTPSDVATTQPDILSSIKEITGCLIDSAMETLENIQQFNETEQTAYSQIRDDPNPLSTNSKFGGLPLSLGFAVQLVEHFGSPGVPLDTLLPDDYVVPLDWATSKLIYLYWKASVEKKQKNNISKKDGALSVTLEDSN